MSWRIEWTPAAIRDLRHMDRQVAERVRTAVRRLAETQYGDVIRLTSTEPEWRLRVGDWRVRFVYDFEHRVIRVLRVRPRGRAYRD
ncbi:MAG TPA: type II toxin-antitoxin system RelE/ParE family toxin [Chloroflexota bacterium]|nr:type II toxin-antitoxin system RelE/ParE family toxin [Chloroflexota bacterium]